MENKKVLAAVIIVLSFCLVASLIIIFMNYFKEEDTGTYAYVPDHQHSRRLGDIDGDGFVDATDATLILEYYSYTSTTTDEVPMTMEEFLKSMKENEEE